MSGNKVHTDEDLWLLIQDYAEGKLSNEGHLRVEKWLETNEDARVTLEGFKKIKEDLPAEDRRKQYFQAQIAEVTEQVKSKKNAIDQRKTWLIAASVVLIMSLFLYLLIRPSNAPFDQLLEAYSEEFYSAPFSTRDMAEQDLWITYYQKRSFTKVIELLAQEKTLTPRGQFYMALSYFYTEEYENTVLILEQNSFHSSLYEEQRNWFLSLAYLQTDQPQRGIQQLDKIVRNQSYKHEEAKKLLDTM